MLLPTGSWPTKKALPASSDVEHLVEAGKEYTLKHEKEPICSRGCSLIEGFWKLWERTQIAVERALEVTRVQRP